MITAQDTQALTAAADAWTGPARRVRDYVERSSRPLTPQQRGDIARRASSAMLVASRIRMAAEGLLDALEAEEAIQ